MKSIIKVALTLTALAISGQSMASSGCSFSDSSSFLPTCGSEKKEVIITGLISPETLAKEAWFDESLKDYKIDEATLAPLKAVTTPTEIVVIIGTWCPDCHRETPRFIKIIDTINNPNITVKYIGIDRTKTDPDGLAKAYEFTRIPTFIVYQDGKEIGRIIEKPAVSLEQDLVAILK